MKRFWTQATLAEADGALQVLLDGRPMRLPGGEPLRLRGRALAEAVRAEWDAAGGAAGGEMSLDEVPLTRLAGTAQGRIAADTVATVAALAAYGETDLLCYRAEAPDALVALQASEWDPLLDWAAAALGARLLVTAGIVHRAQPPAALAALHAAVAARGVLVLAGLGVAVPALGSLVLGLALAAGRVDAARAHELASLDERFQVERWGEDREAMLRRRGVAADVALAARFMDLAARDGRAA